MMTHSELLTVNTESPMRTKHGSDRGVPPPLRVLIQRHCLLWLLVGIGLLVGGLAWLVWPRTYEAQVTLLAPKEASGVGVGSVLLSQAEQVVGGSLPLPGLFPGLTRNRDVVVSILKSRTLADATLDRFHLVTYYRVRTRTAAYRQFWRAMRILVSKEGAITVIMRDGDPQRAADLANFCVDQLDVILNRLTIGQAGQSRSFLDGQLQQTQQALRKSEDALKRFQEQHRAIVLPEQSKAAIEGQAKLKGELLATETQLEVIRGFFTDADPQVIRLRRKADELQMQLKQLRQGQGGEGELSFPQVPTIAMELARLTREVKLQETVYTLLTQQREKARMAEAQDLPSVQVLDHPVVPDEPVSPRLGTALALGAAGGLILGISLAFGLEAWAVFRREELRP